MNINYLNNVELFAYQPDFYYVIENVQYAIDV